MKKIFALVICLITLLTLFACGKKDGDTSFSEDDLEENVEYNDPSNQVIASIILKDGEQYDIMLSELDAYMGDYIVNYDSEFYLNNTTEDINIFYDELVDGFVRDRVEEIMAKDMGYCDALGEDELKDIEAQVETEMVTIRENCLYNAIYEFAYEKASKDDPDGDEMSWDAAAMDYIAAYDAGDTDDEKDIQKLAEKMMEDHIDVTGQDEDYYREYFTLQIAVEKMYDDITKGISVSEEELIERYKENIELDKKYYEESPDEFEADYISGVAFYRPSGYRRVKHILIAIDSTTLEEISLFEAEGKMDDADALRTQAFEEIYSEADRVLELCRAEDADFDMLLSEHTDDPNVEYYSNGYIVGSNSTLYDESFKNAVWNMDEEGEISGLVKSSSGYHIIKLMEEIEEGPVDYDDIRDHLEMTLLDERYVETFEIAYNEYVEENLEIEYFKDIYHITDSQE